MSQWQDLSKSEFLKTQLEFPRVRSALEAKESYLKTLLLKHGIYSFEFDLYLRAFKQEELLEIWVRQKDSTNFKKIKTYEFCRNSGLPGPKRKEGDYQIPEGFYRISHYNPKSNFLLSLKVNYPNTSDKILSDPDRPGDDIYIHGGCQTIGCIPLTDDKIQEVYLLAVLAKSENQSVPIDIFPFRMTVEKLRQHLTVYPEHEAFWSDLKVGYDFFEKNKQLPVVSVQPNGAYRCYSQ